MFNNTLRLPFKVFGIPVLLHWTLLLILPFMAWTIGNHAGALARPLGIAPFLLTQGATPYVLGTVAAIGLFVSVLVHEFGHALTARAYGVPTRSISLWLLGGIAQFEQMPRQRGAEAVVAIAGPLTSLALAALFAAGQALTPPTMPALLFVFFYLKLTNFILAVFNLLPALPLDGGRVLRSLLALKLGQVRATNIAAGISMVLAAGLGLFGLMTGQLLTVLVAAFVFFAVNGEKRQVLAAEALRGIGVQDLMTRQVVTVEPELTVGELKERMLREHHLGFPVRNGEVMGLVTLRHLDGVPATARVAEVMTREPATIPAHDSALEALARIGDDDFGRLIVTDERGQMVGIITRTDLLHALRVRQAEAA